MKKRIVCVLLTLIMLMSLVPVTASAAGRTVSESAITILKQMEGYTTNCGGKGKTFGYGTICTDKTAHTKHTEKEADVALRDALKKLDDAVNSFASKKGLALSQNKHDALVLFSFENGTAWTTGTGDFQAAVTSGKTGSDFLNAIRDNGLQSLLMDRTVLLVDGMKENTPTKTFAVEQVEYFVACGLMSTMLRWHQYGFQSTPEEMGAVFNELLTAARVSLSRLLL